MSVSAQKTYKVGDYYNENGKEGVVFWVDESGEHGKIVSMKGAEGKMWTSDRIEADRLIGADHETDGAKNMDVVKQIPDWESKYSAFKWCADLGEGWYLPAKVELAMFSIDFGLVNRSLKKHGGEALGKKHSCYVHWSSTECGKTDPQTGNFKVGAWDYSLCGVDFSNLRLGKRNGLDVRAVSAF